MMKWLAAKAENFITAFILGLLFGAGLHLMGYQIVVQQVP